MPKIKNYHEIDISPEKFLAACSVNELHEIDLLMSSPRFRNKMGDDFPHGEPKYTNEEYLNLHGSAEGAYPGIARGRRPNQSSINLKMKIYGVS